MTKRIISIVVTMYMMMLLLVTFATTASAATISVNVKPIVLISGGDEYNIVWGTNVNSIGYVTYTVGGTTYTVYDEQNGVVRTDDNMHTVRIPQVHLDSAGSYTVVSKEVTSRSGYNINFGTTVQFSRTFKGYKGESSVTFAAMSDTHFDPHNATNKTETFNFLKNRMETVHADADVIVLNGDICGDCLQTETEYYALLEFMNIAGSDGTKPVIYVVGNHEKRGFYSKEFEKHFVYNTGEFYGRLDYGPASIIVLDSGEDKEDTREEYGHDGTAGLVDFNHYYDEQIEWAESMGGYRADAEYTFSISHSLEPFCNVRYRQQDIRKPLIEYGTHLVIAGHTHRLAHRWSEPFGNLSYPGLIDGYRDGTGFTSSSITCKDGSYTIKRYNKSGSICSCENCITYGNGEIITYTPPQTTATTYTAEATQQTVQATQQTTQTQSTTQIATAYGLSTTAVKSASATISQITKPVVFDCGYYYSVVWQTTSGIKCGGYVAVEGDTSYWNGSHGGKLRTETTHSVRIPKSKLAGKTYTVKNRTIGNYNAYGFCDGANVEYGAWVSSEPITMAALPNDSSSKFTALAVANKTGGKTAATELLSKYSTTPNLLVMLGDMAPALDTEADFGKYILEYAAEVTGGKYPVVFCRGEGESKGAFAANVSRFIRVFTGDGAMAGFNTDYAYGSNYSFIALDTATKNADSFSGYKRYASFNTIRQKQTTWLEQISGSINCNYNLVFANADNLSNCVGVNFAQNFKNVGTHLVVAAGSGSAKFTKGGHAYSQANVGDALGLVLTCANNKIKVESINSSTTTLGEVDTKTTNYIYNHTYRADFDTTSHWQVCTICGEKNNIVTHGFDNACDTTCNGCNYVRETAHNYQIKHDDTSHFEECSVCQHKTNYAVHSFDKDNNTLCGDCGYKKPATASGDCGDNATWEFYQDTGLFIISGTGDVDYSGSTPPWEHYKNDITTVIINDGVTSTGAFSFENCSNLTSVTIPNSVTVIDAGAFSHCSSLKSITIPNSVTKIYELAFEDCSSLESITIPDSVKEILFYAFYGCSSLESITLPDSSIDIYGDVFYNTAYYNNSDNWDKGVLFIGKHLIAADESLSGNYSIKNGALTIAGGAFENCSSLTSITIPEGVVSIGYGAFAYCSRLTSITMPKTLAAIDSDAFSGTALDTVNYAGSVADRENIIIDEFANDPLLNATWVYDYHEYDNDCDTKCNLCEKTREITHNYQIKHDDTSHFEECSVCGDKTNIKEQSIKNVSAKAPTCEEIGWDAYKYCENCDYSTYVEKSATGHSLKNVDAKAKTCTTVGWNAYEYCEDCDHTTYVEIPASHEFINVNAKDKTCTENGYTAHKQCADCGEIIGKVVIPASHGNYVQNKDDKEHWLECEDCQDKKDIAEHSFDNDCDTTCNGCDFTRVTDHHYDKAHDDTNHWEECPACHDKQNIAEHSFDNDCDTTCNGCDFTRVTDHHYDKTHDDTNHWEECPVCHDKINVQSANYVQKYDGTKHWNECSVCQGKVNEATHTIHNVGEQASTCTEDGWDAYKYCEHCDYTTTYVKRPAGHKLQEVEAKDKTCDEDGYTAHKACTECDYKDDAYQVIPASHELINVDAKAKTCMNDGYTAHKACTECDYKDDAYQVIPASHELINVDAKAKTCINDGYTAHKACEDCDYKEGYQVILAGHTLYKVAGKDKRCAQDGWTPYQQCYKCDYNTKVIIPAGHQLVNVDAKAKTCTTAGWNAYEYCQDCNYTTKVEIPASHNIKQIAAKAKTCTENGYTAHKACADCGYTEGKQIIAKGHSLSDYVYNGDATTSADGTKTRRCLVCDYNETIVAAGTKLPAPLPAPEQQPQEKPIQDTTQIFVDVEQTWYTSYVNYAYTHGVFKGNPDGTFKPLSNITRAEFVQVLANLTGINTADKLVATRFSDVNPGDWYAPAIKWASESNIVSGLENNRFGPEQNITREQMCVMIVNYAQKYKGITLAVVEAKEAFCDDGAISSWAKDAVYTCQMADIVNGKGEGRFDPQGTGLRAEASVIFSKFHQSYLSK